MGGSAGSHAGANGADARAVFPGLDYTLKRHVGQPRFRALTIFLMSSDQQSAQTRLMSLRQEHRDLDDAIAHLSTAPSADQLQLRRMKKRKLRLRDQISYWESKLIPDLDA